MERPNTRGAHRKSGTSVEVFPTTSLKSRKKSSLSRPAPVSDLNFKKPERVSRLPSAARPGSLMVKRKKTAVLKGIERPPPRTTRSISSRRTVKTLKSPRLNKRNVKRSDAASEAKKSVLSSKNDRSRSLSGSGPGNEVDDGAAAVPVIRKSPRLPRPNQKFLSTQSPLSFNAAMRMAKKASRQLQSEISPLDLITAIETLNIDVEPSAVGIITEFASSGIINPAASLKTLITDSGPTTPSRRKKSSTGTLLTPRRSARKSGFSTASTAVFAAEASTSHFHTPPRNAMVTPTIRPEPLLEGPSVKDAPTPPLISFAMTPSRTARKSRPSQSMKSSEKVAPVVKQPKPKKITAEPQSVPSAEAETVVESSDVTAVGNDMRESSMTSCGTADSDLDLVLLPAPKLSTSSKKRKFDERGSLADWFSATELVSVKDELASGSQYSMTPSQKGRSRKLTFLDSIEEDEVVILPMMKLTDEMQATIALERSKKSRPKSKASSSRGPVTPAPVSAVTTCGSPCQPKQLSQGPTSRPAYSTQTSDLSVTGSNSAQDDLPRDIGSDRGSLAASSGRSPAGACSLFTISPCQSDVLTLDTLEVRCSPPVDFDTIVPPADAQVPLFNEIPAIFLLESGLATGIPQLETPIPSGDAIQKRQKSSQSSATSSNVRVSSASSSSSKSAVQSPMKSTKTQTINVTAIYQHNREFNRFHVKFSDGKEGAVDYDDVYRNEASRELLLEFLAMSADPKIMKQGGVRLPEKSAAKPLSQ